MLGTPRRGSSGAWLVVAGVLVAAATAAAWARGESESGDETGSLAEANGDPEAERMLEAVQTATAGASSFRFRFRGVDTTMAYWDDTDRRFTGRARGPPSGGAW